MKLIPYKVHNLPLAGLALLTKSSHPNRLPQTPVLDLSLLPACGKSLPIPMKLHYPLLVYLPQIPKSPHSKPHPTLPAAQLPASRNTPTSKFAPGTQSEEHTSSAHAKSRLRATYERRIRTSRRGNSQHKPILPARGSITKLAEDAHIVAQIRVSDQDEMLLCTRDRNALASLVAEERLTTAVNNGRKHDGIELLALGRVN